MREIPGAFFLRAPFNIALVRWHYGFSEPTIKTFIRFFFKALRIVLGPVILLWEIVSRPSGLKRTPAKQAEVDQQCQDLALYQFKTCPFCLKVRQEMRRLSLPIERRDAQHDEKNRAALLKGSGLTQVPCLQISAANEPVRWLNGSGPIIAYLRERFASN